jgi:arylsulfatase A-like enzyme
VLPWLIWTALALWIVPEIIASAYNGTSVGPLNRLISGQGQHPVTDYLDQWASLARMVTTFLLYGYLVGLLFTSLKTAVARAGSTPVAGDPEASVASEDRTGGVTAIFVMAIWFGLLTGLTEAGHLAKKHVMNEWIPVRFAVSEDFVWMAPLAYAGLFLVVALVLFPVRARWPRLFSVPRLAMLFASIGTLAVLRAPGNRLSLYASVALAVGFGVVFFRIVQDRSDAFCSVLKRTIGYIGAVIALLTVGIHGVEWATHRRALADLPPAAESSPNVLFIILDTVRAQNLGLYGYSRPTTPELERLAETGVVFDRALVPSSWTLPTHASGFTGRLPHELSADWKVALDDTYPTLAEVLQARGYETGGFVGNFYYCSEQFGIDRGFLHYEDQPISPGMILQSAWLPREVARTVRRWFGNRQDLARKTAADLNSDFLAWLGGRGDAPFFAFLNYYDAHDPYLPPEPFNLRFSERQPRYWLEGDTSDEYTPEEIGELVDAYDASIAYLDHQLGVLFGELEQAGTLENTLVIITSDHGEEFGEHDYMFHGHTLYMPLLHVPLLVSFPGRIAEGVRIDQPVSIKDLPATVIDLLGFEDDAGVAGRTLAGLLGGSGMSDPMPILSAVNQRRNPPRGEWMWSILDGTHHYIRNVDGREELYDLASDPWERTDLSQSVDGAALVEALRTRLTEQAPDAVAGSREPEPANVQNR